MASEAEGVPISFRFLPRVRIAPGLRINLSKSGASMMRRLGWPGREAEENGPRRPTARRVSLLPYGRAGCQPKRAIDLIGAFS